MLNLKKIFRAVTTLMLISLIFMPVVAFAQTEGQTLVEESGLSVKWIEPEINYVNISAIGSFSDGLCVIMATLKDKSYTYKYGIMDEAGKMVLPIIYDNVGGFSEELCYAQLGIKKMFIDKAGKEILDVSDYSEVKGFSEGLCYARLDSKKVFIDKNGKEILDVSIYDEAEGFRNGYSQVILNGKKGLINKSGYEILPCDYDDVNSNNDGLIWARKDGLYGYFDSSGNEISGMVYNDIGTYGVYDNEFMVVKKDVKWGVVDNQANVIIPIVYDYAMPSDDDIVALRKGDKWEFVNVKDENIIPFQFDYPKEFSEGLARVKKDDKYGYIDKQGEIVIQYQYDYASDFYKGMASVAEIVNGEYYYYAIDKTGKKLTEHKDYYIKTQDDALIAQHEPAGGLIEWLGAPSYLEALLDVEGNRLTDFSYTNISGFEEGVSVALKYETSLYGMINRYGEEVVPFIFNSIEMINKDSCMVKIRDSDYSNIRLGILTLPVDAAARKPSFERPITVYLDGLDLYFDTELKIVNDRTMVPMRRIFEALGSDVSWDDQLKKVTAIKGNTKIELNIRSNAAFINGEAIALDVPAIIENNRTLVPLRFVSEALDCEVKWDADIRRALITSRNKKYGTEEIGDEEIGDGVARNRGRGC